MLFRTFTTLALYELQDLADIQECGTLHGRASGDCKEALPVGDRCFSTRFSDIQWNGQDGSTELIGNCSMTTRQSCNLRGELSEELKGTAIDVQFLMIEHTWVVGEFSRRLPKKYNPEHVHEHEHVSRQTRMRVGEYPTMQLARAPPVIRR